jgi:hypothetical protein
LFDEGEAEDGPPGLVALDQDEDSAKYVGHTADGRQFFLTTPFVPGIGDEEGCEFVALYLFEAEGKFLEARIDSFGPRETMDEAAARTLLERRLKELGPVTYGRIEVAPFSVTRFGTEFGFIARPPEEEAEPWSVEVMPGNYMAFQAPWDSGDYDT